MVYWLYGALFENTIMTIASCNQESACISKRLLEGLFYWGSAWNKTDENTRTTFNQSKLKIKYLHSCLIILRSEPRMLCLEMLFDSTCSAAVTRGKSMVTHLAYVLTHPPSPSIYLYALSHILHLLNCQSFPSLPLFHSVWPTFASRDVALHTN